MRFCEQPLDSAIANFRLPAKGSVLSPAECCDLAIMAAYQGIGRVSPNPLVGAVIVDHEHRLLATGAHLVCGEHHAEINALQNLGDNIDLKRATMFVTLEPCSVTGRTPACASRLVLERVGHVCFGAVDPDMRVNGAGRKLLADAGIRVELLKDWQEACHDLAEIFVHNCKSDLPFIAMKIASGLDGNMARSGDERRWITGERARSYGHFLRGYYDAILVGAGTVESDNPVLDTRNALVSSRNPHRIVLDPRASLADRVKSWHVFREGIETTYWIVGEQFKEKAEATGWPAKVLTAPVRQHGFELRAVLRSLRDDGVQSILIEGGPTTASRFLAAGLLDKLHLFQASSVSGGPGMLNWTGLAPRALDLRFGSPQISPLGEDWVVETKLKRESS